MGDRAKPGVEYLTRFFFMVSYPYSLQARLGGSAESILSISWNARQEQDQQRSILLSYLKKVPPTKKRRPKGALGRTSGRAEVWNPLPRRLAIRLYTVSYYQSSEKQAQRCF